MKALIHYAVKVGNDDVKSLALSLGQAEVVKLLEDIEVWKNY